VFGLKRREQERVAERVSSLEAERNQACARERASDDKLLEAQRELIRYREKLTTVTEVAGEMASKKKAVEHDLAVTSARLKTAMSLLDVVRSVPELVLELASEGREEPILYDRAERVGVAREMQSISSARGIVLGMKAARTVADARAHVLYTRIQAFEDVAIDEEEYTTVINLEGEDTRRVKMQSAKDA
jgi:hypothetical protein